MSDVHRFVPRRADARTEYIAGTVFAFLLVVGYLYLGRGERDWGLMIGLGAGVAALVFAGYFVRTRLQWVDELELSGEGVTQVSRGVSRTLPWTAVKDVKRFTRGSEQWILSTHPGHQPMTIRADGLNRDEVKQIRELIPALHAAAARPPGVPVHEG